MGSQYPNSYPTVTVSLGEDALLAMLLAEMAGDDVAVTPSGCTQVMLFWVRGNVRVRLSLSLLRIPN